jgi:hypothetical protein
MSGRETSFPDPIRDAIPDLVLGLFSVPVAFAVQNIAQEAIGQQASFYEGITYITLFMTLYAVYAVSLLLLLEHVHRWATYAILLLLGAIASIAVILAGVYYPDVSKAQAASVVGMLAPVLTFGFVLLYQPRMSRGRQPLVNILHGLYGILVFLLCLIIYGVVR